MNNKKNTTKKNNGNANLAENNDQIGENASEEYRSEEYSNAFENKNKYPQSK